MASIGHSTFLAGVIEGFYGPPWTLEERLQLFHWMSRWGLNTYFYCPKDDLKHRAIWRQLYTPEEAASLRQVIGACHDQELRFIYGIGPGLDIRYSDPNELTCLTARFEQMLEMGCDAFAVLFDDIPDQLDPADLQRWGSLASAHAATTNALFAWLRERRPDAPLLFCPTPYCGRMAERKLGGEGYLEIIGRELHAQIDVFWTGPEIISREITLEHINVLTRLLRRAPVIWDNLHANDYDGRRCFCGPYSGRPAEVKPLLRGILLNPNTEFPLNFVPLRTLAEFVAGKGDWEPRQAYLGALSEWLPHFESVRGPAELEDLVRFCDCYYLPYEDGAMAATLRSLLAGLLGSSPASWGDDAIEFRKAASRLRQFCVWISELRNRSLFYALSRRIWELREELDLLEKYVEFHSATRKASEQFRSDYHLPETYRGGFVAGLQRLLEQANDGTFVPSVRSLPTAATASDTSNTSAMI